MIHDNSRDANDNGKGGPFGKRAKAIIGAYQSVGSMIDRQVKDYLRLPDMNCVRPRITELIKLGVLEECETACDPVTGMTVRVVRLASAQKKLF